MSSAGDMAADFAKMHPHGFGVGIGQHEGGPFTACRTNGPKQVGVLIALIGRLPWSCSFPGPQACHWVFLVNPRFILPPNLYGFTARNIA